MNHPQHGFRDGFARIQQVFWSMLLSCRRQYEKLRRFFLRSVKVSVIVPVYNVESCLETCLNSCIRQTLKDIEIICVNDGSTDSSLNILKAMARQDRRIRIFSKPNGGLSTARNTGIDFSRGEILIFLDSDDCLAPNACQRVWEEMHREPTDIVIFGTEIFPQEPKAPDWYHETLHVCSHRRRGFESSVLFEEPSAKPFVWRQAFSRRLLEDTGVRFDERVPFGEDMVFLMELYPHAQNFSFIEDKLYRYCWHREGSLMHQFNADPEKKIRHHLEFVWLITEYWQAQGWLQLWGKEYTRWLLAFLVPSCKSQHIKHPQEYLSGLLYLLKTFSLEQHLDHMSGYAALLADTVKNSSRNI